MTKPRQPGRPYKVPGIGTERRIRALVAAGWSYPLLGEFLGVSTDMVFKWSRCGRRNLYSTTAELVDALYHWIAAEPPPENTATECRAVSYARTTAIRNGWAAPDRWGPDIDDPAARPIAPPATSIAEKFCGCHQYMPNEHTAEGYVCMGCGWPVNYGRPVEPALTPPTRLPLAPVASPDGDEVAA